MNFYDTNILLSNLEYVKQNGNFMISLVTIDELEGIKTSGTKDDSVKYQARRAVKFLTKNREMWTTVNPSYSSTKMFMNGLPDTNDGFIIAHFLYACYEDPIANITFVTNDLLCSIYAQQTSKNVLILQDAIEEEKLYSGYKEVELTNDEYTQMFEDYHNGLNPYDLIENQYLIVRDENKKVTEYRFSNGELKNLKFSKTVKGLNSKQRCAIDLLCNEDIPIKVICGVYGTGKTYLSVNIASEKVTRESKSNFSKIFLVRQPYGEGEEIGYLKGSKDEKIRDFFKPIVDNLEGGEFTLNNLLENQQLECDVPYYMKGRNLPSTIVLVDEAEDLTLKQIKLLGSRIAEKSNIVFMGDWNQSSGKYEYNCGLVSFIKYIQENPNKLVGVMVMDEDVRSTASKYFADII